MSLVKSIFMKGSDPSTKYKGEFIQNIEENSSIITHRYLKASIKENQTKGQKHLPNRAVISTPLKNILNQICLKHNNSLKTYIICNDSIFYKYSGQNLGQSQKDHIAGG